MDGYLIPAEPSVSELVVVNSRFIVSVLRVSEQADVRGTLNQIRTSMPDASHHVYAFRVGHGNSVIDGLSDDGEPSGTAGPPVMSVLRGRDVGDTLVVVTRYFGGTKLGTGGLVRAYTDAARLGLENTRFEHKIARTPLGLSVPYALYEPLRLLIVQHQGQILDETFDAEVTLFFDVPVSEVEPLRHEVRERSAGRLQLLDLS